MKCSDVTQSSVLIASSWIALKNAPHVSFQSVVKIVQKVLITGENARYLLMPTTNSGNFFKYFSDQIIFVYPVDMMGTKLTVQSLF